MKKINKQDVLRSYYLPPWRSIGIGVILMGMGLSITFGMIDYSRTAWEIIQEVLVSFESIGSFFFSLLALFFKALFLISGYLFVRYAKGIERARLDRKGFYFRDIPTGNRLDKISMDVGPLKFIPYDAIDSLSAKRNFWSGMQLYLETGGKVTLLTALGVLKKSEKMEIVSIVSERLHRPGKQTKG